MKIEDYDFGTRPKWCPGCGNFSTWVGLRQALVATNVEPHNLSVVYGIGCHGHMSNMLKCYGFESLHGREIPVAIGAKLANNNLKVIAVAGDGDCYGEGLNHFINAARMNIGMTLMVFNNMVYGLTTGQTSPTSAKGFKTKTTPSGSIDTPINPLALAISAGATFVARVFAGDLQSMKKIVAEAMNHEGFALVDVLQPCVTFNKINTFEFYQKHIYKLQDENHDTGDKNKAFAKAFEWGERIPTGIFYKEERQSYESSLNPVKMPLYNQDRTSVDVGKLIDEFA